MILRIIFCITLSITPIVLLNYIKNRYQKQLVTCRRRTQYKYKIIFTTYQNYLCKQHIYKKLPCNEFCSYNYLCDIVKFLNSAKYSVNMCMCLLTFIEIQDSLINLKNRGVKVRFITDKQMAENTAAQIPRLVQEGIPIKIQQDANTILHHKFCLVDEIDKSRAKLFFGSLNLTCQGLTSNWDYIIFTNNSDIISRYEEEFNYLWSTFLDYNK